MKTSFTDIVNVEQIGKRTMANLNNILLQAQKEEVPPAKEDRHRVLLMAIDVQNDFMEGGSLGAPGAHQDVTNLTRVSLS